jgi:hypothetical protein
VLEKRYLKKDKNGRVIETPEEPGPHGHEVAVLQSSRPMNRAQELRSRGGSFVAVALYATAGLVSEHARHFLTGHLS